MRTFEYACPSNLDEVNAALAGASDVSVLAGGMTMIPAMKLRLSTPGKLVDLGKLEELRGIRVEKDRIIIGAMTTHAGVAASPDVQKAIPALAALAGGIGDPQVRNRGTIGGSVANNDPAADYPAALLALGANVITNKRTIAADAFFIGMFETALAPREIITEISFPVPVAAAYEKFRSPASRYALTGVFVARTASGVRVAITGAGPAVFRATAIESVLSEKFSVESLEGLRFPNDNLNSDMHGSAQYRAHLIGVLSRRAVAALTGSGASGK